MRFAIVLVVLCAGVFALVFFWPSAGRGEMFVCSVTGIHDGDGPIYCAEGPKVRLTAIAARELDGSCSPGHPCPEASAAAATSELRRLALGQRLSCEKTGTSYTRTTAWCWRSDGVELNCAMMRSGKAAYWAKFDSAGRICKLPRPDIVAP
jgi:endonuclease YncB( thermonuclease family)